MFNVPSYFQYLIVSNYPFTNYIIHFSLLQNTLHMPMFNLHMVNKYNTKSRYIH